jgi:CheY-like chemotaxis protein
VEDPAGLQSFADANNMLVIEDACHALGTKYSNSAHSVGSCAHSIAACFSFHPAKTIAMGEGGARGTMGEGVARGTARSPATGDAGAPDLPRLRILIVDDLAANRELISTMLGPFDIELVEAGDGIEAVAAADDSRFDLILMDLQMPRMDGLAATRAIRAHSRRNRATPILAFTANVLPEHISACRQAGLNDHIGKPIVVDELLDKIQQWTLQSRSSMSDDG